MKLPTEVQTLLQRRFAGQHRAWLAGDDPAQQWPLVITLAPPSEAQALQHSEAVRAWLAAWRDWRGAGTVQWVERRWRTLGTQRLPASLQLDDVHAVCAWIGETQRWQLAESRHASLCGRWPSMAQASARLFYALAELTEADFSRLLATLEWLKQHPASALYPRQLPIPGIDSKWIESHKGLLSKLLAVPGRGDVAATVDDFYTLCGLLPPPNTVHLRVLDPALRATLHGLCDIRAPVAQLAGMQLQVSTVLVVENLQSGLALPDLPGTVALIALGYRVDVLAQIPWIRDCKGWYWGDIDTHGYAILHRARAYLPQLRSLLMDQATLLQFAALWSSEPSQCAAQDLSRLLPAELAVYQGLLQHRWGHCVRLEQERILWPVALQSLREVIAID